MPDWLEGVLSPLKNATDTLKDLVEIRDQIKFGESVSHLYAQVLAAYQGAIAAQTHEVAMLQENRALREQIAQLEAWEHQEKRYQLKRLEPGVFLYALKRGMEEDEPPHYACPACYQRRKRSILQSQGQGMGLERFHCYECNSTLETGNFQAPRQDYDYDPFADR